MFHTDLRWTDLLFMLQGAGITIGLTFWSVLLGSIGGICFGILRALWPRATLPLAWVLDAFRSIPLLIQLVVANAVKSVLELDASVFTVSCAVLGVYCAAYCTEVVRAGILAVPGNLQKAARSLGMNATQTLLWVTLPLAARVGFAGWINLGLGVMKDTSLALWIGVMELLRASQVITTRTQEPLLALGLAGCLYYVMSLVIAKAGAAVENKWASR